MHPDYDIQLLRRSQRADKFVEMVESAEQGGKFDITRDGKPIAVVVSKVEWDNLWDALESAQLNSIEARNPGIDMDEVRRTRAGK